MATVPAPISELVGRRVLEIASARLADEPVIALQGPRTVGKSTLLNELARSHGVEVIDLDEPAMREAVRADPAAFIGGPWPVCVDEYQHVPAMLDAIKAELNRELRPGRFVIAGSTRYEALPLAAQSLTGRLHLLTVWPFTQGELGRTRENLLEALLDDPDGAAPRGTVSTASRPDYIARVVAGGMPIPLSRRTIVGRNRWFDDYVQLVIERDVRELSTLRRREQLPLLFRRVAAQTASVLNITAAASEAGLDRATASAYLKLLEAVFLTLRLPAWGSTLRTRASKAPKIHLVDSGVAARMLRLTPEKLARRDPASLSQFGHLLETFVVGELLRQASWLEEVSVCGHWRTHDGDEVDLIVERGDGRVLAFEVKAAGRVEDAALRHLRKLRDALGERLLAGVMLYTGAHAYRPEERLHVMPIDRIWTPV
jgi:predicted AAA+ superfamily ATPase